MERFVIQPRPNYKAEIANIGYTFHQQDGAGIPTWNESIYYKLNRSEAHALEEAAERVHAMLLVCFKKVVREKLYPIVGIDPELAEQITASWDRSEPAMCARLDFIYDGATPKLVDYNADYVENLFEAGPVQKQWQEQVFPSADQCNRLHDKLVEHWRQMAVGRHNLQPLYVTTFTPEPVDESTVNYMGTCAQQAGWNVHFIATQDIGWDSEREVFLDMSNQPIGWVYKQVPWDWLIKQKFYDNIKPSGSLWIEPLYKLAWSNKALLSLMWEMYPEHPNLLPTFRDPTPLRATDQRFVQKPVYGRYGENVQVREGYNVIAEVRGEAYDGDYVYQAFQEAPSFDGNTPNFGVWVVNDEAVAISVREDPSLIVHGGSRFVPHIVE